MKKVFFTLINPYVLGAVTALGIVLGVIGAIICNPSGESYWTFPTHFFFLPLDYVMVFAPIFAIVGGYNGFKDWLEGRKQKRQGKSK